MVNGCGATNVKSSSTVAPFAMVPMGLNLFGVLRRGDEDGIDIGVLAGVGLDGVDPRCGVHQHRYLADELTGWLALGESDARAGDRVAGGEYVARHGDVLDWRQDEVQYQRMRDAAMRVIREIGVETGGSNVQFAIHPQTGRMTIIEMNPRVSRSSALASKATGFPIAKIAAKLAVGYTLDEIPNDITRKTPACFEPTIDYVVVKVPKWQFEKFPGADETLGPQMKSVGEVMAIGRTFKEAMMKALRSLETGKRVGSETIEPRRLMQRLVTPQPQRLDYIRYAFRTGMTVREVARITAMDPWFLYQLKEITDTIGLLGTTKIDTVTPSVLRKAKRMGISDARIAEVWHLDAGTGADEVRELRTATASSRSLSSWIPARRSSRARLRISIRPMTKRMRRHPPPGARSSSSAPAPTALGRESSSTTAAATPPSR